MVRAPATCSRRGKWSEERHSRATERSIERKVAMPTAAAVQGLRFLSVSTLLTRSSSLLRLPVPVYFLYSFYFLLSLLNPPTPHPSFNPANFAFASPAPPWSPSSSFSHSKPILYEYLSEAGILLISSFHCVQRLARILRHFFGNFLRIHLDEAFGDLISEEVIVIVLARLAMDLTIFIQVTRHILGAYTLRKPAKYLNKVDYSLC